MSDGRWTMGRGVVGRLGGSGTCLQGCVDVRNDGAMSATIDEERCPATHNPGYWPYTTKCIRLAHADEDHVDKHGTHWTADTEASQWIPYDRAQMHAFGKARLPLQFYELSGGVVVIECVKLHSGRSCKLVWTVTEDFDVSQVIRHVLGG